VRELIVTFRKNTPILCGGCDTSFVPPDGPVLGVDDRHPHDIWPVVRCPNCNETVACSFNHVEAATIT
jgi:hypothetical protein